MCFVNDNYDWTAAVQTEDTPTADKPLKCDECSGDIAVGESYIYVWQQERECCDQCEDGWCECPKDEDGYCIECKCEEPAYGETYEYRCCQNCAKFLDAIEEVEIADGCAKHEARPLLGAMDEELRELGMDRVRVYVKHAAKTRPELRAYLGQMWKDWFV